MGRWRIPGSLSRFSFQSVCTNADNWQSVTTPHHSPFSAPLDSPSNPNLPHRPHPKALLLPLAFFLLISCRCFCIGTGAGSWKSFWRWRCTARNKLGWWWSWRSTASSRWPTRCRGRRTGRRWKSAPWRCRASMWWWRRAGWQRWSWSPAGKGGESQNSILRFTVA